MPLSGTWLAVYPLFYCSCGPAEALSRVPGTINAFRFSWLRLANSFLTLLAILGVRVFR